MNDKATLLIGDSRYHFDVLTGTENEKCIDIRNLRARNRAYYHGSGVWQYRFLLFFDNICRWEKRYHAATVATPLRRSQRKTRFVETAYLILYGELPTVTQLNDFREALAEHAPIHTNLEHHFSGFPKSAPPDGNPVRHVEPGFLFSSRGARCSLGRACF